jgi:hypothetical protein
VWGFGEVGGKAVIKAAGSIVRIIDKVIQILATCGVILCFTQQKQLFDS